MGGFVGEGFRPGGEASAARAGIVQLFARVRCGLRGLDVAARADAGIGAALFAQEVEGGAVDRLAFGLHVFLVPVEAEPLQVFDGLGRRAGLVFRMVEVFHAEDDLAVLRPGAQPRDQERPHVAEMQRPRRAWRKPTSVRSSHVRAQGASPLVDLD